MTQCSLRFHKLRAVLAIYFLLFVLQNAFIPTMPHDENPEVMQPDIGRWYGM